MTSAQVTFKTAMVFIAAGIVGFALYGALSLGRHLVRGSEPAPVSLRVPFPEPRPVVWPSCKPHYVEVPFNDTPEIPRPDAGQLEEVWRFFPDLNVGDRRQFIEPV